MPALWDILEDKTKVELAQAFNLSVYFVETEYGVQIRLRNIYYGEEEDIEEIDKIMREKPQHPKRIV